MNREMGLPIHPASVTLTRVPFDSGVSAYVHVPPNAPPALGSIWVTIFHGGDDSSTISGTSKPPHLLTPDFVPVAIRQPLRFLQGGKPGRSAANITYHLPDAFRRLPQRNRARGVVLASNKHADQCHQGEQSREDAHDHEQPLHGR